VKLLITIPAYNEEASIQNIIERSLTARERIISTSPIDSVDITVVSDGSTDRTVELARTYTDRISLIEFEKNRGYGAAIKEAWRQSDADVLGFLDADGTCDPNFFSSLCTTLDQKNADVVLGCRLNDQSKMPLIRRIGNIIFAALLTLLASSRVRDTASGMRVIRRRSLPRLYPLPDGMHFTPAMSARALLDRDLRITEVDMPYSEREGESKLSVGKDGVRFLRVILESSLLYRPSRPLGLLAVLSLLAGVAVMITPAIYYLTHHKILEWMIYRFVVSNLAITAGALLLSACYLTGKTVRVALMGASRPDWFLYHVEKFVKSRWFWSVPAALVLGGGLLVLPSFLELVRTGATYEHWSRFIAMSFMYSLAVILAVTKAMDYVLKLVEDRVGYMQSEGAASDFVRKTPKSALSAAASASA
jgi:glycosyltransferase involved in cell wall biosynthesis